MKTIIGIGVLLGSFAEADRYVGFGGKNGMVVIGHTLVWHSQTPDWVFKHADGKPATRELLLGRMEKHIQTVVGSYKGRIRGWDVVNEALSDNGGLRKSRWLKIIGGKCEVRQGDNRVSFELKSGEKLSLASDLKRSESK